MAGYTLVVARVPMQLIDVLLVGAVAGLAVSAAGFWLSNASIGPLDAILAAAYCGIGPVAGGFLLWSRAMIASTSRLAPLGYAIPVLSTALLVTSGAPLGRRGAIGAALVVGSTVAVLLVQRRGAGSRQARGAEDSSQDTKPV